MVLKFEQMGPAAIVGYGCISYKITKPASGVYLLEYGLASAPFSTQDEAIEFAKEYEKKINA